MLGYQITPSIHMLLGFLMELVTCVGTRECYTNKIAPHVQICHFSLAYGKKQEGNKKKNQKTKKNGREVGGHTKEVVSTTPVGVVGGSLTGRCSLT